MTRSAVRWSTVVLVVTGVLGIVTVAVAVAAGAATSLRVYAVIGAVVAAAIAVVGRLVVTSAHPRVDGPRIGLLTQLCGLGPLLSTAMDVAAATGSSAAVQRADESAWSLNFAPVLALALCFPDGRPRGAWRVVTWACALQPVAAIVPAALLGDEAAAPAIFALPALFVLVVIAVVRRYRAADEEGRRVLSWLTATALLTPVTLIVADVGYLLTGAFDIAGVAVAMLAVGAALAVAVTALRGRLASLDRTLASAVLVVVQVLGLGLIVALASAASATVPYPGSAIVTGIAAVVLFAPLLVVNRRWVRRWLLPRRRRALAIARGFVASVRDGTEPAERVEEVLQEAVGDPSVRLRFAEPDEPHDVASPPDALRLLAGSHHLADVVREPVSGAGPDAASGPGPVVGDRDLRETLAELRLPIEVVRLRRDLDRSLREIERSRTRILVATVAERQRLGRDLHDGPQQALVALGMELRAAQRHALRGADTEADLHRAVGLVQTALAELRLVAHGASPAGIEAGLGPAIRAMVARLPVPVELELHDTDLDLDEPARSTAYYVASEAVTNALKHASARRIRISGARDAAVFRLRVEDDGVGGADPGGSGLTGLRDRVEAAGGRLALVTAPGEGTRLEAELPCGS